MLVHKEGTWAQNDALHKLMLHDTHEAVDVVAQVYYRKYGLSFDIIGSFLAYSLPWSLGILVVGSALFE